MTTTDLERAIEFATKAHEGQVDKLGEPYIDHCKRVMEAVSEPAKLVAVLHDVAEDTRWTIQGVVKELGLSADEASALRLLRHDPDRLSYADYVGWMSVTLGRAAAVAREVKIADLRDNLDRWTPEVGKDLKRRYERALEVLTRGEDT